MSEYISREAALDAISEWLMKALNSENMSSYNDGERAAYRTALSEIAELPAADVRSVVKSKWDDNHVSFYRGCPECGAFVSANLDEVFLRDFPSAVGKLNFCPNCGADMRAEGGE